MFENLTEKFERAFKVLKGQGQITEINVAETLKEVRKALLDADVNFKIAKQFTDTVKEKALGENVLTAISPGQLMIKITHDELAGLMGGSNVELNLQSSPGYPAIILMSGLQGSGKTTFSGKLAMYLRDKKGKKPLLVACDVYRPAAINQLQTLGTQLNIPVFADVESKDPVSISKRAIEFAKENHHNVVIVDTAGRLAVDEQMMSEIAMVKQAIQPSETLFVVDSMTGQDAVNTAKAFNDRINFDGVVLTKLDGDTRGGAALTVKYTVGKPIKFVSTGEKMEALDVFYPDRMAQRILGMGDIVSLVEKAQMEFDEEEAKRVEKRIKQNKFDFNDFLGQMQQIKRMGDLKSLMSMIPGMSKAIKDVDIDDRALVRVEAIIQSMTPYERSNPDSLNLGRKKRIARGCGQTLDQINLFVKNFNDMRKMMHTMMNSPMGKMGMPGMGMPKGGFRR